MSVSPPSGRGPSVPEVDQSDVRERVRELVAAGDLASLPELLPDLHPSDVADVLASLEEEDRLALVRALPVELASEALAEMDEDEERGELLAALAPEKGAELIRELDDDDAADLIADLDPAEQRRILARLPEEDAGGLRELLLFGEETAGRLMTTSLVAVSSVQNGRSSGRSSISARSPVSVASAHSLMRASHVRSSAVRLSSTALTAPNRCRQR